MASAVPNLEWSPPVPNVPELAAQGLDQVPERYVRDGEVETIAAVHSDLSLRVPLIDMTKLVNPDSRDEELRNLHLACRDWGAFQITNHGIPIETLKKMSNKTREFFELQLEEKKRWAKKPNNLEGYGQVFVNSEEQKLNWNDMMFLRTLPGEIRNLEFWPDNPPNFREIIEKYSEEIRQITICLTKYIAMSLKLDGEEMSTTYEEGMYQLRFNCYPPCPEPDRVFGLDPHTDICGITFLLDCDDTTGLQVEKDGKWLTIEPVDGALVVNIGCIIERMSNGICKAAYHRAVVNKWKRRLSVAAFCYPKLAAAIGPVEELTGPANPPRFKTVSGEEYLQCFLNWTRDGPFLDNFKI